MKVREGEIMNTGRRRDDSNVHSATKPSQDPFTMKFHQHLNTVAIKTSDVTIICVH